MEAYPPEYVEHNLPLVTLSGLGQRQDTPEYTSPIYQLESGTKIQSSSPECSGERAQSLLQQFLRIDGSSLPWNASALPGPTGNLKYKIKAVGRSYILPPRKAAPLAHSPSADGMPTQHGSQGRTELHSPLSPLSPGSPIFPDGLFTPMWLVKHQYQVPALFLAFFNISGADSQDADEQLKADINAIKTAISRSGFKTRLAVVLISDKSILNAPQLEERLSSIRRLTSLDSKTGLFFMPPMSSQGEIATFVHSVMTTLQPLCIEYYRDLTKHARRKKTKNSGSSPSVSLASGAVLESLSPAGWNVRYEVKQAIFAEMRQEMDIAERLYSSIIYDMCMADGIFDKTPSESPRWNQARLLCDCLALRVIRCQLWSSQTTAAARFWITYKVRMKAVVQRLGKGAETYSWIAWEARWAEIMAQLVQRADPQSLQQPMTVASAEPTEVAPQQIYAPPEKVFAAIERLPPFYHLHHAGYWLRLALQGCRRRWQRGQAIPDEDQIPPDQSPASAVASKGFDQDLYLVPEPYTEAQMARGRLNGSDNANSHLDVIITLSEQASDRFNGKSQVRSAKSLRLELAHDFIRDGKDDEAFEILKSLWEDTTWRREDWYDIFANLLLALRQCAQTMGAPELMVATTYELMSIPSHLLASTELNLNSALDRVQLNDAPLALSFQDDQRLCPVGLSFGFAESESHVGDALQCQIEIVSRANDKSGPLNINSVNFRIGSSKTITISHRDTDAEEVVDFSKSTEGNNSTVTGDANLTLQSGQRRIFNFSITYREAAVYRLKDASIQISSEAFRIEHKFTEEHISHANNIYAKTNSGKLQKLQASHIDTTTVAVLPKPPKVKLIVHGQHKEYYTDEVIQLEVELKNHEVEHVKGQVSARIASDAEESMQLGWLDNSNTGSPEQALQDTREAPVVVDIPEIVTAGSHRVVLVVRMPAQPMNTEILVTLEYKLTSDQETFLQKTLSIAIDAVAPFEAKFNFGPLLYPGRWPSYFDTELGISNDKPSGIPQLWRIGSLIRNHASSSLVVHNIKPVVEKVVGDSHASPQEQALEKQLVFSPSHTERFNVQLRTEKESIDDRRPTSVDSTLAVTWSRDHDNAEHTTTHLPVPRLTLPVSEPRVLCTVHTASPEDDHDAVLSYHVENPSTHFLTFAVTMEATDDFAFSGPKFRTLSLAPLSRYKIEYRITLQLGEDGVSTPSKSADKDGRWIWPSLQVVDSYYQKTLRVHPGGAGVRLDDKQNIGVLIE